MHYIEQANERSRVMIEIIDIDIEHLGIPTAASAERCLVRFWLNDWPVGQAHEAGPVGRILPLTELARTTVGDDVRNYALSNARLDIDQKTEVDTSIVICTRDRPDALARCLASLPHQTTIPKQVIVVDNASIDQRTRDIALAASVDYVREDRPGLDIARNTGARRALGRIVAYTDDDVVLHPRWLERITRAFDDESITAVTGLVLPGELKTEAQMLFEEHWSFNKGFRRIDFGAEFFSADRDAGCPAWEIGAGANMAFRRNVFDKVGWFDERLDVGAAGCSGDSEFWHRLLAHGLICRYEPGAVAYHFHRRDLAGLSNQIFHYLRGHSAALMVQYERTGNIGNLKRAFIHLPKWYARRVMGRMIHGSRDENKFLYEEIKGYLSGIYFYAKHRRPINIEY